MIFLSVSGSSEWQQSPEADGTWIWPSHCNPSPVSLQWKRRPSGQLLVWGLQFLVIQHSLLAFGSLVNFHNQVQLTWNLYKYLPRTEFQLLFAKLLWQLYEWPQLVTSTSVLLSICSFGCHNHSCRAWPDQPPWFQFLEVGREKGFGMREKSFCEACTQVKSLQPGRMEFYS